jgi:hypothetical protein
VSDYDLKKNSKKERPGKGEPGKDEFADLREMLRGAIPALQRPELRRDLWPDMLRRLEQSPVRVPWFDWALLAFTGAALIFFPALIPALLYQL